MTQTYIFKPGIPALSANLNTFQSGLIQLFGGTTVSPSIISGLVPTINGLNIEVTAGLFHAPDQNLAFLPYQLPAIVNAEATTVTSPATYSGYVIATWSVSPQTSGATTYTTTGTISLTTDLPLATDPAIVICGVTTTAGVVTIDTSIQATNYQNLITLAAGEVLSANGQVVLNIVSPTEDQVMLYNSITQQWENGQLVLDNLADVTITTPANNQVLLYNGTAWINSTLSEITSLNQLSDVALASPVLNQVLTYNGTDWINQSTALANDSDVVITSPVADQVLVYNGTTWINTTVPSVSLNSLSDVTITSPTANQVLAYNGTEWVNSTVPSVSLNSLSDVSLTTPTTNQVLTYDGTDWINQQTALANDSDVVLTSTISGQFLTYNGTNWINQGGSLLGISTTTNGTLNWTNEVGTFAGAEISSNNILFITTGTYLLEFTQYLSVSGTPQIGDSASTVISPALPSGITQISPAISNANYVLSAQVSNNAGTLFFTPCGYLLLNVTAPGAISLAIATESGTIDTAETLVKITQIS